MGDSFVHSATVASNEKEQARKEEKKIKREEAVTEKKSKPAGGNAKDTFTYDESIRATRLYFGGDDLAAKVIQHLMSTVPNLAKEQVDDVIVGNATPEAEQGLNIGRMISLMGLNTDKVPGMTVNRYCSSGSETIAIASAKVHSGQADVIVAGGVECMSPIPFGGWRIVPNAKVANLLLHLFYPFFLSHNYLYNITPVFWT